MKKFGLTHSGFSKPAVLAVALLVIIVAAWGFRYFWKASRPYEAIDVSVLEVNSVELGGVESRGKSLAWTNEGVAIDVVLSGSTCPKGGVFATKIPAAERQAYLGFWCDPSAKPEKADEQSLRRVRYLWSPKPATVSGSRGTLTEVHELLIGPLARNANEIYRAEVVLDAEFVDAGNGLFTPKVKYRSPALAKIPRISQTTAAPVPAGQAAEPQNKGAI